MCKASIEARFVTDAKPGESYQIGESSHGLGAFHPTGKRPEDCVACVKDKTTLTLSAIPKTLQTQFGLGATAVATFVDTGDNYHDQLRFDNGSVADLIDFADCGVTAYVGVPVTATARERELEAA